MEGRPNTPAFDGLETQIDHEDTPASREPESSQCPESRPIGAPDVETPEFHPLADVFPLLEDEAFDDLVADIKRNGLREPIVLTPDGRILDGRNRYLACRAAKQKPWFVTTEELPEKWPSFVISENIRRRHLTASQLATVAVELVIGMSDDRDTAKPANLPGRSSQVDAANRLGVSERHVRDAVKVKRASKELFQLVKAGKVAVDVAAKTVRHGPEYVAAFIELVEAGQTPANAKREIEAAKEPVLAKDSVALNEADGGAASPRVEDESDQLVYIGIDGRGEAVAVIDGRSYVFYISESCGGPDRRLHVENPRPLETDEFCRTIVKPRALKLVQEICKKRDEVNKKFVREWEAEKDRALRESEAKANVQVADGVDMILALVKDRGVRPFYMGHAWIDGERFNFNYAPKTNTVTAFREVDGSSSLEDQEVEEAAAPRIRKLLTPRALKNAVPMRERDVT